MKNVIKSIVHTTGYTLVKKQPNDYRKHSYSQCGEDLIVKYIFNQLGVQNPSYLDIGAHHPYYLSNTALFYEMGCRGINVEPDPILMENFIEHRTRDANLNIGISDTKSVLDFYIINNPVLNTFSKEEAENYHKEGDYQIVDQRKVEVDTVQSVLDKHNNGRCPEFLTIDAEGVDEVVLKTLDLANNYPIVICIETISFSNKGKGRKNTEMIEFIKSKGYVLYADTYINSIFVRQEKWENQ